MEKIDTTKCMSRKNKTTGLHEQCPNKKKIGDFCGKHNNTNVLRIDCPLKTSDLKRTRNSSSKTQKLNAIIIQKYTRRYIINNILKRTYNPLYHNKILCTNEFDYISLETIVNDIPKYKLFCFKYKNEIIGFNIETLYILIENEQFNDPVTNKEYSNEIKINVLERAAFMQKHNLWEYDKYKGLSNKQIEMSIIINICKILEDQDFFFPVEELREIVEKNKLKTLIHECRLIWHQATIKSNIENDLEYTFFNILNKPVNINIDMLTKLHIFVELMSNRNNKIKKNDKKYIRSIFCSALNYTDPNLKKYFET
jgi:hypothetical protein